VSNNLLNISVSASHDELPADKPGAIVDCMVVLEPLIALDTEVNRTTKANICLLIDCSGSMYGIKLEAAISTAKMIVEILHERHQLSLVAFETDSHIIFKNAAPSDDNKDHLKEKIDELDDHSFGMTDMAAGIECAMECFAEGSADSYIALIISDGEPDSVERTQELAEEASQQGVQFHAVGVGKDFNADQLQSLVTPSNGAVYRDSDVEHMDEIFRGIVERIDRIVATNVRLNISYDERSDLQRVARVAPDYAIFDLSKLDYSSDNLRLQVGNVEGDNLYEFHLKFELGNFKPGITELVNVRLDYDVYSHGIKSEEFQEIALDISFTESQDSESDTDDLWTAIDDDADLENDDEVSYEAVDTQPIPLAYELATKQLLDDDELAELEKDIKGDATVVVEEPEPFEDEFEPDCGGIIVQEFVIDEDPEPVPAPVPTGTSLFDLVLIDSGANPILLMREIRDATEMDVHLVAEIIRSTNTVVTTLTDQAAAESLKNRLAAVGARAEVRANEDGLTRDQL
jgi:uncharacterized protein YegL